MALCTSAAATAESTPPESPQITRSDPTCDAHFVDGLLDDRRVGPRGPAVAHVEQEPLEYLLSALGVRDLGVELHAVHATLAVLERGDRRAGRGGGDDEALRCAHDGITVTHPHDLLHGQAVEQHRAAIRSPELGTPVLPATGALHGAAELLRDELRAVTDAEHRHSGVVHRRVDRAVRPRRARTQDRRRG